MSIQDDIKKSAKEVISFLANSDQINHSTSIDLKTKNTLESDITEFIRKAVVKGLEKASKDCHDRKTRTPGFYPAYHSACDDLYVIIQAMAERIKRGDYEHPTSSVEDFKSPGDNNELT